MTHFFADHVDDLLALFIGIVVTSALIAVIFLSPDLADIALGALIVNLAVVVQHFFGKGPAV